MTTTFPKPRALERMFPDLATIERRSVAQDDEGDEDESWATLHANIRAQLSAFAPAAPPESEVRTGAGVFTELGLRCFLLGDWPDIRVSDRVRVAGRTFDIAGVERDSYGIVTGLVLQERAP